MSVITHLQLFSNMPYRYINQLTKLRQNVHGRVLGASVKNCFPRHKTTSSVRTYLTSLIHIKNVQHVPQQTLSTKTKQHRNVFNTYHPLRSARPFHKVSVSTLCSINLRHKLPSAMTRRHSLQTSSAAISDAASTYDKICSAMWSRPRASNNVNNSVHTPQ